MDANGSPWCRYASRAVRYARRHQLTERGPAGHVDPQRQQIGEAADQRREFGPLPARRGYAEHQVRLAALGVQQGGEAGQQDGERGDPLGAGQLPDRRAEPGGEPLRLVPGDVGALLGTAWSVGSSSRVGASRSRSRQYARCGSTAVEANQSRWWRA